LNYVIYKEFSKSSSDEYQFTKSQLRLIELFSSEINNAKRVEESILLKMLVNENTVSIEKFKNKIHSDYDYNIDDETVRACVLNLNLMFVTENHNKQMISSGVIYDIKVCKIKGDNIISDRSLIDLARNSVLKMYLIDNIDYAVHEYSKVFDKSMFHRGFIRYQKYSRKDVFRILNWEKNPVAQNVGGYVINAAKTQCPVFVNYKKDENISSTTKYEDKFINNFEFEWMSKSNRTLASPEIVEFMKFSGDLRMPLFIKKSNDEGNDFYYMGELTPIRNSFEQRFMVKDSGGKAPVVNIRFLVTPPVESPIYNYLTDS
jgi:hypothetical protein